MPRDSRPQLLPLDASRSAGEEVVIFDGGCCESGWPVYWRWDPARLEPRLATKLRARASRGYGAPALRTPDERAAAESVLIELDATAAQILDRPTEGDTIRRVHSSDLMRHRWQYERVREELYGKGFDRHPRRFARTLAEPFDSSRLVLTSEGRQVPLPAVTVAALGLIGAFIGGLAGAAIGIAVAVATMVVREGIQSWADRDPLFLTTADLQAIADNLEPITVPDTKGTAEHRLALRAVQACRHIAASDFYQRAEDHTGHRALFDVDFEMRQMVCHAHQIHRARQALEHPRTGEADGTDPMSELRPRHQSVIAASLDQLQRHVEVTETYVAELAALDQRPNLNGWARRAFVAATVDALHTYTAASELSTTTKKQIGIGADAENTESTQKEER